MIFTNGAHESAKFLTFRCSGEISPNLYFDRLNFFCWKYIKFQLKKYRGVVSHDTEEWENLRKNRSFVSKMTRIWWILIWAISSLKNLNFEWSLLYKVKNFWPKKVQRSYILWHWGAMQNLEKLVCGLENDMISFENFHHSTWKCQDWYFHGILFSKVENRWAENLRRSYV